MLRYLVRGSKKVSQLPSSTTAADLFDSELFSPPNNDTPREDEIPDVSFHQSEGWCQLPQSKKSGLSNTSSGVFICFFGGRNILTADLFLPSAPLLHAVPFTFISACPLSRSRRTLPPAAVSSVIEPHKSFRAACEFTAQRKLAETESEAYL